MISTASEAGASAWVVQVRLFAGLRQQAGWGQLLVSVAAGDTATPQTIWRQLRLGQAWQAARAAVATPSPAIGMDGSAPGPVPAGTDGAGLSASDALPDGVRVAINQAFAAADTPLADGDELAFLPPISGG